ncbi:bifunctional diguanylate cyclase/phosphodiesterase [Calidifontibacillus erzurumensis]|uniref:EAL domain-containing protein n=1 Tax=Calidifontibacillus erzurumensis TaxID=2741433 RepID=A0A8J8K8J8_9BACI|nr:EAL domain-containing protein [Calidifontibacillus erzurumensis]NSL51951.1 EAL domain-containing protein [Calidifontibacillus erzurumensis]
MTRNIETRTIIVIVVGLFIALNTSLIHELILQYLTHERIFSIHTFIEIINISAALAIAVQAWIAFPHTLSKQRLMLGAIFLSVGMFDIFHLLYEKGMPYYGDNSIQDEHWFWMLARLSLAVGTFVLFCQPERTINIKYRGYTYLFVGLYVALMGIIVSKYVDVLPILATEEDAPTMVKKQLQIFTMVMYCLNAVIFIYIYRKTRNVSHLALIVAFAFSLFCELVLLIPTEHNISGNVVSNFLMLGSFYFFIRGIFAGGIEEPFSKQKEAQIALQESEIQLEKISKKVNYLAYHDELTGLPNRNYLLRCLEEAINNNGSKGHLKIALISINLNRFKNVNDTLGTGMGDLFLKTIAERLLEFKNSEIILSRMVADEFMLFIPNQENIDELIRLANAIHKRIEEPMIAKGIKFHIDSSIGITLFNEMVEDTTQLIKQAQLAMHEAKKNGQSVMVYHPDMNKELMENLLLENDLRQALDRNEMVLHYQPQVNIETGEIIGVEALVRWNHHKKGMIWPSKFIPIAEETGLILPIGTWVLEHACKQLKKWHENGYTQLKLSVNLSLRQLFQEDLVETVAKVLKETKIKPEQLELEITESMTGNTERVIAILQSLKKLGVRISVDDFGTGYSSLSYLYSFPIDQLKIDRSFIMNLFEEENKVIVSTIISMGQNLGLDLIAEGVETIEQIEFLRTYQCVGVQGYLISRPLPADELEQLLSKKRIYFERYTG